VERNLGDASFISHLSQHLPRIPSTLNTRQSYIRYESLAKHDRFEASHWHVLVVCDYKVWLRNGLGGYFQGHR
jgi:hypothetical protein